MLRRLSDSHVAVVGLGYVGMPLALMLAKHMRVTGFDIHQERVEELKEGFDRNREIEGPLLRTTTCDFTSEVPDICDCNVYIVTVPTPIDGHNKPDLGPVESATKTVASVLKKGDIVVYESTVYPGVTEGICGPLLEQGSGLKSGKHFFLGYSPERINPGDAEHTVQKITKVVSGQTEEVSDFLAALYGQMNNGNIFRARDIRTAEASKAIENAQRDINVAFINEVTMILNKLGLSSYDVLEAAGTKWNFLKFSPGLVGGHCIGVDPYYLAECAQNIGHEPRVILAGREINDSMGPYVASCIHDLLVKETGSGKSGKILLMGFTFKENINDIRNTKVLDILKALQALGHDVAIHDPHARLEDVRHEYGIDIMSTLPDKAEYDVAALLVSHDVYKEMTPESLQSIVRRGGVIYDMKGIWRHMAVELAYRFSYQTL
ncbi:MAG: nucleotide sugar dehydrogenase [Micavibrio aeruginosavorus]|uniref:Nucleotide sugar dehydrogenase n=1 Tax=Micavibrio aeruginosavorus TaxID=349221 RepID=A0A7T5UHU7_9BACT|nr:MAG: nucleotide sugar dehydrogenase [Micavibrio aeruginosavorus]